MGGVVLFYNLLPVTCHPKKRPSMYTNRSFLSFFLISYAFFFVFSSFIYFELYQIGEEYTRSWMVAE